MWKELSFEWQTVLSEAWEAFCAGSTPIGAALYNKEGELILSLLQPSDDVWLLDDKGREMTSPEMAQWLEKRMAQSTKRLVFIIGGPYGFSQDVYSRVPGRLSLSKMTFSHQMVRAPNPSFWKMRPSFR